MLDFRLNESQPIASKKLRHPISLWYCLSFRFVSVSVSVSRDGYHCGKNRRRFSVHTTTGLLFLSSILFPNTYDINSHIKDNIYCSAFSSFYKPKLLDSMMIDDIRCLPFAFFSLSFYDQKCPGKLLLYIVSPWYTTSHYIARQTNLVVRIVGYWMILHYSSSMKNL